jgi:hypothetical protein
MPAVLEGGCCTPDELEIEGKAYDMSGWNLWESDGIDIGAIVYQVALGGRGGEHPQVEGLLCVTRTYRRGRYEMQLRVSGAWVASAE